jgi:hypothetical protein
MYMRVDEAGQNRRLAKIVHLSAWWQFVDRQNRLNLFALNEHCPRLRTVQRYQAS